MSSSRTTSARDRIAGAPISWGVCEVPGWGHQLEAERVLDELAGIGVAATEWGPDGFLPDDPAPARALLERHGLALVGGFAPAVLHARDGLEALRPVAERIGAAGGEVLVVAAVGAQDAYESRPELTDDEWARLLEALDASVGLAREYGLRAAVHPHVGTAIERDEDVTRVLEGSSAPLCLDTGHLLIGGTDPVQLARDAGARVTHVHAKDVDAQLAHAVRAGELPYASAVRAGLFRPLGQGAVDVPGLVAALRAAGYDGWYVLEQDVMLDAPPPPGSGPADDVRASIAALETLLGESSPGGSDALGVARPGAPDARARQGHG